MKKGTIAVLFLATILWSNIANAQSIDNAKKMYNYERFATAKAELEKLIQATPNNAEAQYWLALTLIQLSKKDEARKLATAALAATNNDPLVTSALATIDLFDGKKVEAKARFEAALTATNKKTRNPILLAIGRANGSVGISQSDTEYAIAKLNEIIAKEPSNSEALTLLGNVYRRTVEGGGNAVRNYLLATQANPQNAIAFYKMGQVYQTQNNCPFIKENYLKATTIDPMFTPAWREMFEVYSDKESACYNLPEANSYLDKYIAASDPGLESEKIKMKFCFVNNDLKCAISETERMIAKYGENSDMELLVYRAYIYKEMHDSIKAKQAFDAYFAKMDPAKVPYKVALRAGEVTATIPGMEKEAIAYFQKSIDLQPEAKYNLQAFNRMGETYDKLKDYTNAAIWYKKALESAETQTASSLFKLGYAYYKAKDYTNGFSIFQQYDIKFPTDYRGSQWSARCQTGIDTLYTTGAAVPLYQKYIEIVKSDSTKYKGGLIEAYSYLVIYYNSKNNKTEARNYLQSIKFLDPTNVALPALDATVNGAKQTPKPVATPATNTKPTATIPAKPGTTTKPPFVTPKPGTTTKPPVVAVKSGTTKPPVKN